MELNLRLIFEQGFVANCRTYSAAFSYNEAGGKMFQLITQSSQSPAPALCRVVEAPPGCRVAPNLSN
jgi:hypothetical protein